jgi:hypothetical protein
LEPAAAKLAMQETDLFAERRHVPALFIFTQTKNKKLRSP